MIKKIKSHILLIVSVLTLLVPVALPAASYAFDCSGVANQVATGAAGSTQGGSVGCTQTSGVSSTGVQNLAKNIVDVFSIIIGGAAIIMILYAGFRYITSGGSTERIGGAKTTLIYAIVGLVIVALAQLLVHFVLGASINAGNQLTT
jgi:hypothetical protein